jgi:phosphoribosylformylglycinamidine cyclo-ligase
MVAVLDPEDVDRALAVLTARHMPAWVLGDVRRARDVDADPGTPQVLLRGEHPRF